MTQDMGHIKRKLLAGEEINYSSCICKRFKAVVQETDLGTKGSSNCPYTRSQRYPKQRKNTPGLILAAHSSSGIYEWEGEWLWLCQHKKRIWVERKKTQYNLGVFKLHEMNTGRFIDHSEYDGTWTLLNTHNHTPLSNNDCMQLMFSLKRSIDSHAFSQQTDWGTPSCSFEERKPIL